MFHDLPVKRQADGTWSYKTDEVGYRYWIPGGHYYFYAYSCGAVSKLDTNAGYDSFTMDMTNDLAPSDRVLKINNYICDASHQHDLVYASNTGDAMNGIIALASGNSLVSFQFKHLLSKVSAQFVNKFPAGYTAEISNVTIENIRNIGDYNPNAAGGWQNQVRSASGPGLVYLLNTNNPEINPISAEKDKTCTTQSAYVIPFAYSGSEATSETESTWVYIKFTITLYADNVKVTQKELTGKFNPSWKAGYNYLYSIELSGTAANFQAIGFTVATDDQGKVVTDWSSPENEEGYSNVIYIDTTDEESND